MLDRYLDPSSPVEKTLIDYTINNTLSEAEYVVLAAIVRALKPIQLSYEKLCSRDVTLLSAEGAFSFTLRNFMNKTLKWLEALISRLNERRHKTIICLVKYIIKWKMHSTESRSSGHSDTNLEALPAKSVLSSAEKRLLIHLYDENGDEVIALFHSEGGVSQY